MPGLCHLSNRRELLRSLLGGSLLFPGLMSELLGADAGETNIAGGTGPLASKMPHFPVRAKRVILLFSTGGVSHMDTFDHKPELFKADGKMMGIGGGLSNQQRAHATILRLLGFDHTKLTYRHAGRDYRLTDVHGRVVESLIA